MGTTLLRKGNIMNRRFWASINLRETLLIASCTSLKTRVELTHNGQPLEHQDCSSIKEACKWMADRADWYKANYAHLSIRFRVV